MRVLGPSAHARAVYLRVARDSGVLLACLGALKHAGMAANDHSHAHIFSRSCFNHQPTARGSMRAHATRNRHRSDSGGGSGGERYPIFGDGAHTACRRVRGAYEPCVSARPAGGVWAAWLGWEMDGWERRECDWERAPGADL